MTTVTAIRPRRTSGSTITLASGDVFVFDADISESAVDEVRLTEHPIENGRAVSDHAQLVSTTLSMEIVVSGVSMDSTDRSALRDLVAYRRLLAILAATEPLTLVTSTRVYRDFVLTKVSHKHGPETGQKIKPTLEFKQVRFAVAESVKIPETLLGRRRRRSGGSKRRAGKKSSDEQAKTAEKPEAKTEARKESSGRGASTLSGFFD